MIHFMSRSEREAQIKIIDNRFKDIASSAVNISTEKNEDIEITGNKIDGVNDDGINIDGAALQLVHVDPVGGQPGEDVVQRAGGVLTGQDDAQVVCPGVDDGLLRDADEAGLVVVVVLNVLL